MASSGVLGNAADANEHAVAEFVDADTQADASDVAERAGDGERRGRRKEVVSSTGVLDVVATEVAEIALVLRGAGVPPGDSVKSSLPARGVCEPMGAVLSASMKMSRAAHHNWAEPSCAWGH